MKEKKKKKMKKRQSGILGTSTRYDMNTISNMNTPLVMTWMMMTMMITPN